MGKSSKARVTEYYLSVHMGICLSPVRLRHIYFGEKLVVRGDYSETAISTIRVDEPNLFAGPLKEGGVRGWVYWLPGHATQRIPSEVAFRFGLDRDTCPAFRGVATLFFGGLNVPPSSPSISYYDPISGNPTTDYQYDGSVFGGFGYYIAAIPHRGFAWTHNVPYLKSVWATVTGESLPATKAALGTENAMFFAGEEAAMEDCNPAHIIFDALTDPVMGIGAPVALINVDSFVDAAATLFNEKFGLSLGWFQQTTIEDFIVEVLSTIQATVFVNPATGLLDIKLIRGDYDPDTLKIFDKTNCEIENFQRRHWNETINEITLSYTDPGSEKPATVTHQDLGNITIQGQVVPDSRDYPGIRHAELAMQVCIRDLRIAAAPLSTIQITTNRYGWDLVPGDVIKVTDEKLELDETIFRITEIERDILSSDMTISAVEDIFAFQKSTFTGGSGATAADDFVPEPTPQVAIFTAPMFFVRQFLGEEYTPGMNFMAVMAAAPNDGTIRYDLEHEVEDPLTGEMVWESLGMRYFHGYTQLVGNVSREELGYPSTLAADDTLRFTRTISNGEPPVVGGYAVIGTDESTQEIVRLVGRHIVLNTSEFWRVERGMLDTVPQAHERGKPVFFINAENPFGDQTVRAIGEDIRYRIRPMTSRGVLPPEEATIISASVSNRMLRPIRPAGININGGFYAPRFGIPNEENYLDLREASRIRARWARRNRESELVQPLTWLDEDQLPMTDQTTIVRIFSPSGDLLYQDTGLNAEPLDINPTWAGGNGLVRVEFKSILGGLESLQGYSLWIRLGDLAASSGGWDTGWNENWSG